MIASLPMYWRAETADLWRTFWQNVKAGAPDLPELTDPADLSTDWGAHWLDQNLSLSMTCGLPFRTRLRDRVTYVGTLDFGLACPPGHYFSQIIARRGADLSGPLTLAYNAPDSQSGWAAQFAPAPGTPPLLIQNYLVTGAHQASLQAVASGQADVAFIDAVSWRLLDRYEPAAHAITVIGQSEPSPALPLITALGHDPVPLCEAIGKAVQSFRPQNPDAMGGPLSLTILSEEAYFAQKTPPTPDAASSAPAERVRHCNFPQDQH